MVAGELISQSIVNGILLGGIYAVAALGLSLVFGIMDIVNLAHGHLLMVGAYVVGTALFAPVSVLFSDATLLFNDPLSALFIGFVAFLTSGWLTLPVGAAIGHVHRRARGDTDDSVPGAGSLHAVWASVRRY